MGHVEMRKMMGYHVVATDKNSNRTLGRWNVLALTKRDAEEAAQSEAMKNWSFATDYVEFNAHVTRVATTDVAVVCH